MLDQRLKLGSLFAGIGGLDLGFERAGFRVCWQVEIDTYARRVLQKNFPMASLYEDVCAFPPLGANVNVDVLAAGFPCQDISLSGKGEGLEGEQSGLFFQVIRVARELRPRGIVLENVSTLCARGLGVVLGELASLGYDAEWHCIPAASVGALHIRDRVFVIGVLSDSDSERKQSREAKWKDAENAWKSSGREEFGFWDIEPRLGRVADGVPNRIHRNRCLGNSVVPQVAELVAQRTIELLAQ